MRFDYALTSRKEVPLVKGSIDDFVEKHEKKTEEKQEGYTPQEESISYTISPYQTTPYQKKPFLYNPPSDYEEQLAVQRDDCSHNIPLKFVNVEAKSTMGGVLGYVYPGDNKITLRDDMAGSGSSLAKEVDIHECIHTPVGDEWGEYETRLLSRWMMEKPKIKYKK